MDREIIKVKLTSAFKGIDVIRQTPNRSGVWGNCKFYLNEDVEECDWWFTHGALLEKETAMCPKDRTVLWLCEPETIKHYDRNYIRQFHTVRTCQTNLQHPNIVLDQLASVWFIGSWTNPQTGKKEFSSFEDLQKPVGGKTKLLSIATSSKNRTEGHKKRLKLAYALKNHFGEELDMYGAGINLIENKWDAIAPYKYHITLENSYVLHYWTEKLADAFIGEAFPLYYGCPNLNHYFPEKSFMHIDADDIPGTIKKIERAINENLYEKNVEHIREAKKLVMEKYNLFATIASICNSTQQSPYPSSHITLRPEKQPWLKKELITSLQRNSALYMGIRKIYRSYKKMRRA